MAGIFTRNALNRIMEDESLTPQQRTEQVYRLYGLALEDGYVSKTEAQRAREEGVAAPDPKESDEYKALAGEFDAYRTMQAARTGKDFEGVKPKFFETVYGLVDRGEGAKPLREQLACIRERYEEYFTPAEPAPGRPAPRVVLPTGGNPAPGARLSLAEAMRRANAGEQVDISQIGR